MNVNELINLLNKVKDKNKIVFIDWDEFEYEQPKKIVNVDEHEDRVILTDYPFNPHFKLI